MPHWVRLVSHVVVRLILGIWIGANLYFAIVIARAAFRLLPTSELAGQLVDAVYTPLQYYGIAAGLLLAALAVVLRQGRWLATLPAMLSGFCIVSHFVITARMDELRDRAFGAAPEAAASSEFMTLHGVSMGIHSVVLLGAMLLVGLWVHADLQARENP